MKSFILILVTLSVAYADPLMVNTLPPDQKSELTNFICSGDDPKCGDVTLQQAIQSKIQGSGLQITSFSKPGAWVGKGSVGFTFKDADPRNQVTFNCTFNQLNDTDASITNCEGKESRTGKSVSLASFNRASANDPAQNTLRLKGLIAPNPDTVAGPRVDCSASGTCQRGTGTTSPTSTLDVQGGLGVNGSK